MAADISVGIGVLGEKEFKKALDECQNSLKQLDSGLKANAAEFGRSDGALRQSAERVELLKRGYDESAKQVKALGEAVEWSKGQYGELSSQTTKYVIAQNKARESAARFKKELEDVGEETDDLTKDFKEMADGIEDSLESISGASKISAFKDLGDVVGGALDSLASIVDETEEYRRQMSFLERNATDAGFGVEGIKAQLGQIASLTGDADGAFEAISNLMATGFDGQELASAIDLISGAVIKFPETMKFENLSESLQESVASGSATGAYAELIERLGGDLDALNTKLANAATAEERQQIALAALNDGALKQTAENYKAMNADLIANETAQLNFNAAMAGLGEVLTPAATAWTNFKTGVLTGITDMITGYQKWKEEMWAQNAVDKQTISEAVEDATEFSTIEEYTDAIAQADAEGAYARATALVAERDKFLKEQAKKTAEEIDKTSKEDAATIGGNISTEVGNGIVEGADSALNAARSLWQSIADIFGQMITIPAPKIANAGAATDTPSAATSSTRYVGTNASATITLDGKTVGEGMVDYNSDAMGAKLARVETYG